MFLRNFLVVILASFLLLALTNCCTTNNELKEGNLKSKDNQAQRPPSPGNADIKCSIEDIYEKGNRAFCKIKVFSVLKYGSGTRPIGNDSIIELEFKNETKAHLEMLMKNKQEAKMVISEVPGGMGMENSSSYRLLKIIK